MTNYPTDRPRVLTRSRDDRVIAGVCAGAARYLNIDVSVVRIVTVAIMLFAGVGLLAYVVAAVVIPEEGNERSLWQQHNPFTSRSAADPTAPDGPIYGDSSPGDDRGADLR